MRHCSGCGRRSRPPAGTEPVTQRRGGPSRTLLEADVLALLQEGRSNAEIALALQRGVETIRTHARNIFRRLGVRTRRELSVLAGIGPIACATVQLLRESFADRPAFDMAVSYALLQRVAAGELPPTLRIQRHGPAVAFGKLDALVPGYAAARRAAAANGFATFERLAGGRAAVNHEGTIGLGEIVADPRANLHIRERYAFTARVLTEALRRLDVDARVGEVAGEYCPGDFSVNARGARKLSGTAQRVVKDAAYVGTILVVRDAARVAAVVRDVYAALGVEVASETTGAVEDEAPGVTVDTVETALLAAYAAHRNLVPATRDEHTLALAAEHEPRFAAVPVIPEPATSDRGPGAPAG